MKPGHCIANDVADAITLLETSKADAIKRAEGGLERSWLGPLVARLGARAGQGVWLLNKEGIVVDYELPAGLSRVAREAELKRRSLPDTVILTADQLGYLGDRPYFRASQTFQEAFLSDADRSIFNGHVTVFLCQPLVQDKLFYGVIFAALQPGAWMVPVDLAERCLREGKQLVLVDSNGVLLVPTAGDHLGKVVPAGSNGASGVEDEAANSGFPHARMIALSRRDSLVAHIANNIVPLSQDDDILILSADLRQYSVISEIPKTRLKLAVTRSILT